MDGLIMQSVGLDEKTMIFVDLQLTIFEEHNELTALWQYNSDLFEPATIERMAEHFQTLVEGIVADPEQRISDISLLTEAQRRQIVVEWNQTEREYPKDISIHELFEEQVERTPDAIAVVFEEQQLTYRELNVKANQLAHYLRKLGVGPEVLVGICVERSLEMIVGLLGILKAGGAYLPIEPTYPEERINFMLEDSQISVILTQKKLIKNLSLQGFDTLCLDMDWKTIAQENIENPVSGVTAENLIYVIYTSGSTGKPKGAMNIHRALVNRLLWMQDAYQLTGDDRILQKTPFSFDVSGWEFFWPLLTGARLIMAKPEGHKDRTYLVEIINKQHITTLHFVPSMLQLFLEEPEVERCTCLKRIICSGEALPFDLQERFFAKLNAELHNLYGPTEVAIDVTFWKCQRKSNRRIIPIGRPIANTQIYILDQALHPVPIGVPGELHIGGIGLARGYLNRPELTTEKFIPDPFSAYSENRLYKTGDIARYLPDGNIEFLGRLDHQIKIRGLRVELGEIESTLASHPAVSDSVVVTREDTPGEKRLVAYVVSEETQRIQGELPGENLQIEQVSQWQHLYEETYHQETSITDSTFNISGWNSSYTGKPIPEDEMREWVNNTVKRILAHQPKRALEIGCGAGLLLLRIAPLCSNYWGTDFSTTALDFIRQQVKQDLPQVTLLQKMADDFEGIPTDSFDTIIMNSVIQYFPSIEYLFTVLENALQTLSPEGGLIFIGDVRSFPLLETFHTSVQLYQAPPLLTKKQLQQRIRRQVSHENELTVSPAFFTTLRQRFPQICEVRILPKSGRYVNEMTCFRYDVALYVNLETASVGEPEWLDWRKENLTLPAVRRILTETQPEILAISNVPNARLWANLKAVEWLRESERAETVGEFREELRHTSPADAIDPEEFREIAEKSAYTVDFSWAQADPDGSYDLLFRRNNSPLELGQGGVSHFSKNSQFTIHNSQFTIRGNTLLPLLHFPEVSPQQISVEMYTNNPLRGKMVRNLIPRLRGYLQEKLPDYMIPADFVILDAIPLTPNGKIDRRALPEPERIRPELATVYLAPRSELDEALAEIWAELLDLDRIGVNDDFFELGGDSLIVTRLVSRIREELDVELSISSLFEMHTISELAEMIEKRIEEEIDQLSDEEAQRLLEESEENNTCKHNKNRVQPLKKPY